METQYQQDLTDLKEMDDSPKTKSDQWNKRRGRRNREETHSSKMLGNVDENSLVIQEFIKFQKELDSKYDKRERIIKLARDVTILSKRVIFALHRSNDSETLFQALTDADSKIDEIRGFLEKIASELVDEDPYKFARAYSGGIQEFVEAVTFMHYIRANELLKYDELCERYLSFETSGICCVHSNVMLTPADYILGVADLTGELMKMCINEISCGNHERAHEVCHFLRALHDQFLMLPGREIKDLRRKEITLEQSLKKVEGACYTMQLRGLEVPSHMLIDIINMKQVTQDFDSLEYSND